MTGPRSPMFTQTRAEHGVARNVLRVVLVLVLVVVVAWGAVMAGLWGYAWLRLGSVEVPSLTDDREVLGVSGATAPPEATTVLVSLTGPVDPTVPRPSELVAPVVLVQVGGPRARPAALVLSQELEVSVDGAGSMTIADTQREGGSDLLVRAVVDYTEVRIDHVVSASIDALPRLLDVVGEVEVCGAAGCRRPTPDQLRVAVSQSDGEQLVMLVADTLRAIAGEVDLGWVARSPLSTKRLIDAAAEETASDVSLRGAPLLSFARTLEAWDGAIDVDSVPLVVNPASGRALPLEEPAAIRFQHLRDGTPFSGDDAEDAVADLVSGIEVAVLNGAGIDGLASRVRTRLEADGFTVVGTGNAPTFDRDTSVIHYAEGDPNVEYVAVLLAEALDGASLQPLDVPLVFEGEPVDLLVTAAADLDDR